MKYECSDCHKSFDRKSNYDYHVFKRQKPCNVIDTPPAKIKQCSDNDSDTINTNLTCPNCNKSYSRKDSLQRHINEFCKTKGKIIINKNNVPDVSNNQSIKLLSCKYCNKQFKHISSHNRHENHTCQFRNEDTTTIKTLKNRIDELELLLTSNVKDVSITTENNIGTINNGEITNNNINVVNLVAFGKEDMYAIEDTAIKRILNKGYQSVPALIEYIHFNKDRPEFQNVFISNMKSQYANVFNGQRWMIIDKDEVVNQLFDDSQCVLIDRYKELYSFLPDITKKKFQKFKMETDDEIIDGIKHDITLLLYNNRHIPLETKNSQDNSVRFKFN